MTIVLMVLKTIGIVLLVILLLILLALLLVLFVPIRYKIDASINGEVDAKVKITWLLHFINIVVSYTKELFYRVRIAVFTIISSNNKKREKTRKKSKTSKKREKEGKVQQESAESAAEYTIDWNEEESTDDNQAEESTYINKEENIYKDNTEDIEQEPKKTLVARIKEFVIKLCEVINDIRNGAEKSISKIKGLYDDIEYYIDTINDERNKKAFNLCIIQVKSILNNIKPKKIHGSLYYGSDDPAAVGKVLAIAGMLYPIVEDNFTVKGDFNEERLEADLHIKGRVTVFVLIKSAWILYFNKDLRRMIKMLKREE